MKDNVKKKPSIKSTRTWNNQRGALLIGLIITMVIFSVLGGAMVYIFSSSTLNPVSGKYAQQAYYNAEAGFRYVTALYRNTSQETVFDPYRAAAQTITLPGGGSAKVTVSPTFTNNTPASSTANNPGGVPYALPIGGNLTLASATSSGFDAAGGFFTIAGFPNNTFRYMHRDGDQLHEITGFTAASITIANNAAIGSKKSTIITSKGSSGSGLWNVSRTVAYAWALSGTGPGAGAGAGQPQEVNMSTVTGGSGNSTGQFAMATHRSGNTALQVSQIHGPNSANPEAYGVPSFPSGTSNPLYQAWLNSGNYLSYDLQVKVAEQHNHQPLQYNPNTWYHEGDTVWYGNDTTYYEVLNGYWVRVLFVNCFGVFFRINELGTQTTAYGLGFFRGQRVVTDVPLTLIPSGLPDEVPAILFYARDGDQANESNWLAYMALNGGVQHQANNNSLSYVVDPYGFLQDWSSIMVRLVEAASIKLASETVAPLINIGDTITGGPGTAKVIRKIHDSDGNVVLLLNNVQDTFTRPTTVSTYATTSNWTNGIDCTNGYCPRDNYIWAFYADTTAHGSDATPANNVRLAEIPKQNGGTINWAPSDIQAWTSTDDHFTLVTWASSLNTGIDSSLRRMGAGKEANAIIRTRKYASSSAGSAVPTDTSHWTLQSTTPWSNTSNYSSGAVVSYGGNYYKSLQNISSGVSSPEPTADTTHWTPVTPTAWSSSSPYSINNIVSYLGNYYRNTGTPPVTGPPLTNTTYWKQLTSWPTWSSTTTYNIGDSVTSSGYRQACIQDGALGSSKGPWPMNGYGTYWLYYTSSWSSSTAYSRGAYVSNAGNYYICLQNTPLSRQDPTVDTGHWAPVTLADWSSTTLYHTPNDMVTYLGNYYRCTNNTSFSIRPDITNQSYWQQVGPWSGTSSYGVGDLVASNSSCYRCTNPTTPPSVGTFPPELGIIAKGVTAEQFFYDDLAYRIFQGGGAGTPYIPPVQQ